MPRLVNSVTRTDDVTAAINDVIIEHGIEALSMRAIATRIRLSPASLHQHYGSREHMLRVAAHVTGEARLEHIRWRIDDDGPFAWLPGDDEDVLEARAWLGWCEMWRAHDWVSQVVDEIRVHEMAELARHFDYRLVRDDLDTLFALIDGLLVAVCRPRNPLPRTQARRLMGRALRRLIPDGDAANTA